MEATLRAFLNIFPEKMKKRTIWYLFDRYLGHFLREKLTLDQLSIDLIDGKGCINELDLDVDSLNEELSFLPVKFVDGCFIDEISVYVPWSSLLTESCSLQIKGATVICQLDHQLDGRNNQMESDYLTRSIMSSSMQLAEEIVQTNTDQDKFEGLEIFAQLIDSVLRRIELIAIETSFILRSKRKQTRNPATTKVSRGSEDYCDLEIKVGHLRCEENAKEEEEDEGKEREDVNMAPKRIRKKLTITDIEILMDGDRVCTLKETHVMEVNVKDARCDIQVYLASILTGVLKKNQINELFNLVGCKESGQQDGFPRHGEKAITAMDYARIEQQLKMDSARYHLGSSRNNLNATLLGVGGGFAGESCSAWTSAGDNFESCETTTAFMPIDYSCGRRTNCEKKEKKSFHCAIKLPGLALCLVGDSNYAVDCGQINPKANTLDEINCALDKMIDCHHLRLITIPIQVDLGSSGCKINSGDIWVAEYNQRGLCPYVWTEGRSSWSESVMQQFTSSNHRVQLPSNQDLSFQCVITNEKIGIETKNSTNLIIDPTLWERIDRYCPSFSDGSSSSDLSISIVCPEIRGKLLVPVADCRSERPRESELRPFWIEFEGSDLDFTTNTTSFDVTMSKLIVSIGNYTETKEIGRMTSEGSTPIRLNIKKGADASTFVESSNVQTLLEAATMTESIFICTKAQATPETPFQVKTKIMRSENKGDAKTLVPNDINNSRGYFDTCKSFTQLQVELSADNVNIYFERKEQIDLLYNALGNDLALWTPVSDKNPFGGQSRPPPSKYQNYFPCGAEMSDSIESESSFHSIDGSSSNQRLHNYVTCLLRCDTLRVTIGDHLIKSANVFIGLAFGLQDDTSNVISIHGSGVSWSFDDETVIDNNHLCQKENSLDLTFEIDKKEVPVSKSITVAIRLSEAILFKTCPEIFVDFWNCVNVTNDDVLGYTPPKVQTELYTSVVNGAISYGSDCVPAPPRPVLITFDGITVTAMVVEDTSDTLMRFIVEEAAFYFKKNSLSSKCLSNYVCIIDSGLIDMSLKFCEANRIVFKAMNNMINVRACSDSLAALCQLVASLVNQTNDSKAEDDPPSYSKAVGMRKGSNTELIREALMQDIGKQDGGQERGERGERGARGEREERKEGNKKKEGSKKRKEEDKKKKGKTREEKEKEKEKEKDKEERKISRKQKEKIMVTIDSHGPSTSSATGLKKGEMTDSGFWLLGDDDIGAGIKATDEPIVRILNPEPITIMDNFFTAGKKKEPSELLKSLVARYFLEEMTLCLSFYGGRDFEDGQGGNEELSDKMDEKKSNADLDSRSRGELKVRFNNDPETSEDPIQVWESINLEKGSDFVQATSSRPVVGFSHSRKTIGGRLRKNNVCVQLQLTKVRTIFDKFTDSCNVSWRWSLFVKKLEIRDCLSVSNINKMLYEYISEDIPRRNNSSMISIRAKTFRNPVDSHEECDLRVSLKPLRVNIDQDTIMFLFEYFSTLKSLLDSPGVPITPSSSGSNTPSPVYPGSERDFGADYHVTSEENESGLMPEDPLDSKPSSLFVKSFEFTSTVLIRLDYHGKRIDFEQGTIQGLLMGLGHLNHSELYLKRLHQKRGILGVDRVIQFALTEWFEDIKRNQIPRIIGSIGPLNSVRQLFQGVIDLFWIPVDQYRRDRRIFRGIQRGASSFSSSTATAMLDLANRLVHVIQGTAQFAHDVVLTQNRSPQHNIRGSVPTSQPRDLREGVASAYTVMREGLNETYRNVASAGAQAEGVTETVGVLIGTLPSNILHPIIKATEATSNVIVGMRNQLTPEARQDDQYKWKTRINNQ